MKILSAGTSCDSYFVTAGTRTSYVINSNRLFFVFLTKFDWLNRSVDKISYFSLCFRSGSTTNLHPIVSFSLFGVIFVIFLQLFLDVQTAHNLSRRFAACPRSPILNLHSSRRSFRAMSLHFLIPTPSLSSLPPSLPSSSHGESVAKLEPSFGLVSFVCRRPSFQDFVYILLQG